MVKTSIIRFRVTNEEAIRIKNKALLKGYAKVSDYLRALTLRDSLGVEGMVAQIYKKVVLGQKC